MGKKLDEDLKNMQDTHALAEWLKRKIINHQPFTSSKRVSDRGVDKAVKSVSREPSVFVPANARDRVIYTLEDGREFTICIIAEHEQSTDELQPASS
jgi:hypothetical protein